ncbi:MAG TPA: adenylate/guanylate cyclase domain-containing protein [Vicinamibacterales bacterium]|nr:adenylate/guanylate cyclase domain-containing protein [Vicinamibacterales bacterium]
MTVQLVGWVAGVVVAWLAGLGIFLVLLKRRELARFENGLFFSIVLALLGVALMAGSVAGIWGYFSAKNIMDRELITELQDVGGVMESEIMGDVTAVQAQLGSLGGTLAEAMINHASVSELRDRMATAQALSTRYLQLRLLDTSGNLIVATTQADSGLFEPINRIAIGFNLSGQAFVSDAYFSDIFKREMLHVSLPIADKNGHVQGLLSARFDLRAELEALIKSSRFNQSGYALVVDGDGHIIGYPDPSRLNKDFSDNPAVKQAWLTNTMGEIVGPNAFGDTRLFVYRPLKNPGTLAKRPWVLLTEINQSEELAPLRKLGRALLLGMALLVITTLFIAYLVSRSITDPMHTLGVFAQRIGGGDLTERVGISGKDVAGRLASTLNHMADGLQERDHVKEVFGRYIATQVSDKILHGGANLGGESRRVSILFSDIRNFTGMSEQMAPSQVVSFLNDYFSEMVDAVFEQNGILDKFLGDGLMAIFGAFGEGDDHPRHAVLAGLRMKSLLAKINGERSMQGKPPIAIGIGIHTDEVILGNIGSRKRLEYTVVGDGVNTCSRLQGLNKEFGTTILISETTYASVHEEFECRQMPDAQLRGKVKELKFYEVISVKSGVVAAAPALAGV